MVWKHRAKTVDTKEDTGCVRRGLGKGTGVFLKGVTVPFLIKDMFDNDDRICAIVR